MTPRKEIEAAIADKLEEIYCMLVDGGYPTDYLVMFIDKVGGRQQISFNNKYWFEDARQSLNYRRIIVNE